MQDNLKRGMRTLFWTKATLVLFALFAILFVALFQSIEAIEANPESAPMTMGPVLAMLAFGFLGFILSISFCIQGVFWLMWIFRAEENLRCCTRTAFSPWGAVICSCIPYVGFILHFFVFRDMARRMESELAARRRGDVTTYAPPVPMNMLAVFLVCTLLSGVCSVAGESLPVLLGCFVVGITAAICYIKVLSAYVRQESELYALYKDEELRGKVDEVLREREIEKAAAEVKTATYGESGEKPN